MESSEKRPRRSTNNGDEHASHDSEGALQIISRVTSAVVDNSTAAAVAPNIPRSIAAGESEVATRVVTSRSKELLLTLLVIISNLLQFTSMFSTLAGGLEFSRRYGRIPSPGNANWMGAGYGLTQSTMVLVSGRTGAIYGHMNCLMIGIIIIVVFSLGSAFSPTYNTFIAMRAMTGVGGGILMPNAVAALMIATPPGLARNFTLATFAASPPVGAMIGALLAGVFLQETAEWKWLFILIAVAELITLVAIFLVSSRDKPQDPDGKLDLIGICLGLSGLVLFSFSWIQGPAVGWEQPYLIATLVLSVVCLTGFFVWESRYATEPIMPLSIFKAPTFTALMVVVLVTYMSVGIALWYMVAWQQLIRGWSVLEIAIGWIPYGLGASVAVLLAAWLLSRADAKYIMLLGIMCSMISLILLATMPEQQTYWAQTFPSILIGSFCADFVYVAAQLIASNSVSDRDQGIASSLIGTLNLYGNGLGLGFAGTIETQLLQRGASESLSYRAALAFGAGLTFIAVVLNLAFVRVPKDKKGSGVTVMP